MKRSGQYVVICSLLLVLVGLWLVYSSSRIWAAAKYEDPFYYFKRQLIFAMVGLVVMFVATKLNLNTIKEKSNLFLALSIVLLGLVLVPGLGLVRGGSRSWFGVGSFAIQPAEFFKFAIIFYVASNLSSKYLKTKKFISGVLPVIIPALIGFALIMLQPDFGTGIVMLLSVITMTMISRASFSNYFKLGILGLAGLVIIIMIEPYRIARIISFVNPWEDPLGSGFQIIQSLYAIGPGGLLGKGLDGSYQKYFFLPEPQTDFIFAVLAEESGFIGGAIIILVFGILLIHGLKIARDSKNEFNSFLALGLSALIGIQVIINLGVVVGLFPVTGITLPFISYGGSSLTILMFSVGILYNIATNNEEVSG